MNCVRVLSLLLPVIKRFCLEFANCVTQTYKLSSIILNIGKNFDLYLIFFDFTLDFFMQLDVHINTWINTFTLKTRHPPFSGKVIHNALGGGGWWQDFWQVKPPWYPSPPLKFLLTRLSCIVVHEFTYMHSLLTCKYIKNPILFSRSIHILQPFSAVRFNLIEIITSIRSFFIFVTRGVATSGRSGSRIRFKLIAVKWFFYIHAFRHISR